MAQDTAGQRVEPRSSRHWPRSPYMVLGCGLLLVSCLIGGAAVLLARHGGDGSASVRTAAAPSAAAPPVPTRCYPSGSGHVERYGSPRDRSPDRRYCHAHGVCDQEGHEPAANGPPQAAAAASRAVSCRCSRLPVRQLGAQEAPSDCDTGHRELQVGESRATGGPRGHVPDHASRLHSYGAATQGRHGRGGVAAR